MKQFLPFVRHFSFVAVVAMAMQAQAQQNTPLVTSKITVQQSASLNQAAQGRIPRQQACMELTQTNIKLVLWDCGVEDNDTVAISLNGQWILDDFRLTNAKQEIDVTLAPGENQLVLLAKNLGDLHDNTAAMAIKENGVEQQVTLSSNLLTSGTLRLAVKGSDPVNAAITGCPKEPQTFMDEESKMVRANPDLANPAFRFLYTGIGKNPGEKTRQLELQGCTNVSDTVVSLYFWDSGVEDGDTVSINLNGVWVVEKLKLTTKTQSVQVKLKPGSNYIILYAHNLGDLPNNTSGIGVEYKYGKQELGTLFSDMNTSGTFRFNCTLGAEASAQAPCIKTTNASDKAKNDPEMQYLQKAQTNTNPSSQPTSYTPAPTNTGNSGYNQPRVRVYVPAPVPTPRGGGNTGGSSGNTGTKPRKPSGNNNPAPTRNPKPPVNY